MSMRFFSTINLYTTLLRPGKISASSVTSSRIMKLRIQKMWYSASSDRGMDEFVDYLDNLKNYEKIGVPTNAGIDSDDGFDLGRMRRLLDLLGNPQSKYKVVHIAGTKGKGSTAAFLSNILRAEGYTVGCYSSPHIWTIRERMSVGRFGEPVSSSELLKLFHKIKIILDQAVVLEQGQLSYFEVLTSIAFTLFAHLNVDIAVIEAGLGGARDATNIISSSELAASIITTIGEEHLAALGGSLESIALAKSGIIKYKCPVILGGPFFPHIEQIIRDKASSTCSPVVSASDVGNRISIRDIRRLQGKPFQACDIIVQTEKDIFLSLELLDVNLMMLGSHQLLNATTATCTALCLRDQGWKIADQSFRRGLEGTQLLGRGQFLTLEETDKLGVPGTTVLLDGAHTKESAQALVSTIHKVSPQARLVLVVAMASDKDHTSFAREFLKGQPIEAVLLIEVGIAEDSYRTTPAPILKECWVKVSIEQGLDVIHDEMADYQKEKRNPSVNGDTMPRKVMIEVQQSLKNSLRIGSQVLQRRNMYQSDMIVVTGYMRLQYMEQLLNSRRPCLVEIISQAAQNFKQVETRAEQHQP